MLSKEFTNFILLPLLTALDGLLVLGFLSEEADREYLLALLHPTLAPPNHKASFYLLALPVDGSIRSQYCRILEHLCDGQLQKRVKGVIEFSKSFVLALQKDQMNRTDLPKDQLQPKVIQEINTPIENQVTYLMSFNGLSADECSTSKALQEELKIFHAKLTGHCGSSLAHGLSEYNWDKMDFLEKMEKLAKLIYKCQGKNNETEGNVHKLRNVIIFNMLKWSREGIEDIEFAEQVFGLLYRQFNETDMLIKALRRTYIIEDSTEFCTSGIFEFCNALAQVRKMLKIGFSNKEERILEKMLRKLRSNELFKRHPDLLRMTGVHNTVIDVMKSYYNSTDKIMHKITTKQGFIALIEECCLFLCAFAQTSDQNQSALFDHILYFLNHCLKYPEQLNVDACSPMDVAIATINNSHTLVLEISEDHLDIVFDLLDKMTQYVKDDEVDPTMRCSSNEYYFADWSPTGAEKCLRFLQSAVWVNGETISQNACTIIRLMIQHPECLGPGYNNQTLTLVDVFNSSFSHMSRGRTSSMATKRKTASIHRQNNTFIRMETDMKICVSRTLRHHSSTLTLNSVTAELIIAFYNTLVRLLSYCITETQDVNYSSDHILPFMQSLLSKDTLKRLLSFPLSFRASDGMSPTHKEAFLMFLNRAYSIEDHVDLLDLINTVFMPDIEATLYTVKIYRNKYEIVDHFHYICQYVMPFLEYHSKLFPSFGPDLPVVMTMMSQCYSLSKASINCNLSSSKINSFLITLTKILPPQAILKLLPTFLTDISTQSSSLPTVIKVITAHYQHYSSYYSSGILTSAYKLAPPGQIEKVYIALLFSWIFEISHDKVFLPSPLS
jgi:ryanodine receptor 2